MGIIVEGPDGAGKSTLIRTLIDKYPQLTRVRRHVTSDGPVTGDLSRWCGEAVRRDMKNPTRIYDRHPFISEFIYAPLLRGAIDPTLLTANASSLRDFWIQTSLVIWCFPPSFDLSAEPQMAGVADNIDSIVREYRRMEKTWLGPKITYNHHNLTEVEGALGRHLQSHGLHLQMSSTRSGKKDPRNPFPTS